MRRVSPAGLVLAAVLVVIVSWRLFGASSGNDSGGSSDPATPIGTDQGEGGRSSPSRASRPPQISFVSPKEGSTQSPKPEVRVGFSLSGAMLDDGQMYTPAFSLALDGWDVSATTRIQGTMDFPQSIGVLEYRPNAPLAPGRHEAAVSFPDEKKGDVQTYTWSFVVKEAP